MAMADRSLVKLEPAPAATAPDVGLAAIEAEFRATAAAGTLRRRHQPEGFGAPHEQITADDVWLLDLQPQQSTAAGTIDIGQEWGPPAGYVWRLTEVMILFGTGTSLVQLFKSSTLGLVSLMFQTNTSGLWEPARRYLQHGQRLVVSSTGGGVTIVPDGERIATGFFPTYAA